MKTVWKYHFIWHNGKKPYLCAVFACKHVQACVSLPLIIILPFINSHSCDSRSMHMKISTHMKMYRRLLSLLSLVLSFSTAFSSAPSDSLTLTGNVLDAYTYDYLDGVSVELLAPADSSVVFADSCRNLSLDFDYWFQKYLRQSHADMGKYIIYKMRVMPGEYLLRCSREGYATQLMPVSIPARTYGRRTKEWKAPDVLLLRQMQQQLGEASVRATKILMVHKGDTVVFNADYFQLSQGNMLDELVKMLPGMEIREGGQIYYNGHHLSNLYVNGKDFFEGDAKVALQNLPAYMVKRLKVYKKEDDEAYLNRHRDTASIKVPNTLDVTLKKEYNKGWVANVQAGGGPALRGNAWEGAKYLERLFAQYRQDNLQLSIVGNVNNISNTQVANDESGWVSGWNPGNGVLKLAYGGLNFNASSKKQKLDYVLKFTATSELTDHESLTSSTTFLNASDTYSRDHKSGQERHPHIILSNSLKRTGDRLYVYLFLGADYFDDRSDWLNRSAQFAANPADSYRGAAIDSLFDGPYSQRLAGILTNRMEQATMKHGTTWWQTSRLNLAFKDPLLGNRMSINTYGMFAHVASDAFEHYDLRYPDPATTDFRNRYTDLLTKDFTGLVSADYDFANMMSETLEKRLQARLTYEYNRKQTRGHSWLYNLHCIDGWGNAADLSSTDDAVMPPLGALPSVVGWRNMTGVQDPNSYDRDSHTNSHCIYANLRVGKYDSRWGYVYLVPQVYVQHDYYADSRSDEEGKRTIRNGNLNFSYNLQRKKQVEGNSMQHQFSLGYVTYLQPYSMTYMLAIRDDSDPLHITLGNRSLRNARRHGVSTSYNLRMPSGAYMGIDASFTLTQNEVAMGYTYNTQTGAYTYCPQNVDGNRRGDAGIGFNSRLGKKEIYRVDGRLRWNYNHSVDIVNSCLSTVDNQSVSPSLRLSARYGQLLNVALACGLNWQYATSNRENYHTRNTWDVHYGPKLTLHLPHDLSFDTDFTIFQRRGYDDRSMNNTEMVWNANLEWNFDFRRSSYNHSADASATGSGKGRRPWTLGIKGHDLLHQLSNTRRVLNSQGITETWYNVVPSYVMLTLTYRFAKLPKKQ